MKFEDVILQTATKVIVFIVLIFGVYVFFSGHHEPGGGFIGGLITASAIVLLLMAFDVKTVRDNLPVDFKLVGAAGILIMILSGAASMLLGEAFLFQTFTEVDLPVFGPTELATAVLFDVGVYLAVAGTALTIILSISEDK